jgi:hypothetical protein
VERPLRGDRQGSGEAIVGGERVAPHDITPAGRVVRAGLERLLEHRIERADALGVVVSRGDRQVDRAVEDEGPDVAGVGERVRLSVLGAVALAVEVERVDAEPLPERSRSSTDRRVE